MGRGRIVIALVLATVVIAIAILLITLTPTPVDRPYGHSVAWIVAHLRARPGLEWFSYAWLERIANVVMFVPLAALVTRLVGRRWWWTVVLGCAALSTGVELIQYRFLPERTASVGDVVTNTLGALVGAGIGVALDRGASRRAERTRQK